MTAPYRTDARTQALEHVAATARAFLEALATDPGWPEKRRQDLEDALAAIPPENASRGLSGDKCARGPGCPLHTDYGCP